MVKEEDVTVEVENKEVEGDSGVVKEDVKVEDGEEVENKEVEGDSELVKEEDVKVQVENKEVEDKESLVESKPSVDRRKMFRRRRMSSRLNN